MYRKDFKIIILLYILLRSRLLYKGWPTKIAKYTELLMTKICESYIKIPQSFQDDYFFCQGPYLVLFMCHPLHYGAIRPSRDAGQCNLIVIFVKGESKQILANGGCNTPQVPCTHRLLVNWGNERQTRTIQIQYKGRGGNVAVENLALSRDCCQAKCSVKNRLLGASQ